MFASLIWKVKSCRRVAKGLLPSVCRCHPGVCLIYGRTLPGSGTLISTRFPGYYFSGDGGYRDEDGYVFITGRMDDVINVAGHRLSTTTMEEVLASHPAVAECAVIGITHELKGQVPLGFVVLKDNTRVEEEPTSARNREHGT